MALEVAGEFEVLREVEGGGAGLGFEDGAGDCAVVGFPGGGGGGEAVGADEEDAVGGRDGAEPADGVGAGEVHECGVGAVGECGAHPGGSVEDEDVVAALVERAAELEFGKGEEEQGHAEKLEEQRDGLLDFAAARDGGRLAGRDPEAKGGDDLFAARAVEEIQCDGDCGDRAEEYQELAESEVKEFHSVGFRDLSLLLI